MAPRHGYSEDALVERPAIAEFAALKWETADCFDEFERPGGSPLGRETTGEVVLLSRLRPALRKLNPGLPEQALALAEEILLRDRSAMGAAQANREVHALLRNGVKVTLRASDDDAEETTETVRVVDWERPKDNDFFLASQLWVSGDLYTRRADLVGFVNGIPLVFAELKASHRRLETAYRRNLRDYRDTIPHLFWYNGLIILSNGSKTRIGSTTAQWEHFGEWKKVSSEGEEGVVSLETAIRGTCEKSRLLDLIENFVVFTEMPRSSRHPSGGLVKVLAKNHQYLGVNNALDAVRKIRDNQGRLGVFWHTQGSGKSYSMLFFSQKVLRKLPGEWSFVVVTDRDQLDGQIYKTFARSGAVTESEGQTHAGSAVHLRQLLSEDHRYVFTLIHKFRTERRETHPVVSERSDVIVIADEAHRSQYDTLARNMRTALPNAAFIAFTGTPLIAGEERTREVFGDYVSIYDFKQSSDDGNTVPLFYENRIPELQLTNENLNQDMERLLEEAELDEEQEAKLEREFAREYHLITRDDRLETIARDLVEHFTGRGYRGKAMVVCIDKATAVRMYDKVQAHWKRRLEGLRAQGRLGLDAEMTDLIAYMQTTDMAVVVSQAQNEVDDCRRKGADIRPHRRRMLSEDLEEKFKDENDPFRIVFVCAMWMTGFDAPCCSTIYLDKPMRNHTLMQTIARANRVFQDKVNGLIVDYVGVFRNLQQALAIYGSGAGGRAKPGETPITPKDELIRLLEQAVASATTFCAERRVELGRLQEADGFQLVRLLDDAVEAFLENDDTKRRYLALAADAQRLYKAVLPDPTANQWAGVVRLLDVLAKKIRSLASAADISGVMEAVEQLLDDSIAAEGYVIREGTAEYGESRRVDLSQIDFEALRRRFEAGKKRTEFEKLRATVERTLRTLVRLNRSRLDYAERFQQMIDEYNAATANVEEWFNRLVVFAQELTQEQQRSVAEGLSEEELAVFDILTRPDMHLTTSEERLVKKAARDLLEALKRERLVLDWRKRQETRAGVQVAIQDILNRELPEKYKKPVYDAKCAAVFQHVYESYYGAGGSLYAAGAA